MKFLKQVRQGKLITRLETSECLWCVQGLDPGAAGQTICRNCHAKFKRLLSSTAWHRVRIALITSIDTCQCQMCKSLGRVTSSSEIDHILPWSSWPSLFWEPTNHKPLCRSCHRIKTLDDGTMDIPLEPK